MSGIDRTETRSTTFSSGKASSVSTLWTRPATHGYRIGELLAFPRRVINPPVSEVPMLATARSFRLRPVYGIKLDAMLAGHYLPPLGLRDFEEWLLFTEHSAENLYFLQWLKDFTQHYNDGSWTDSHLWMSFLRAKSSFFVPNGSLELNLPYPVVREIAAISMGSTIRSPTSATHQSALRNPNSPPFSSPYNTNGFDESFIAGPPSPTQLAAAEQHVRQMLTNSLMKFANEATSNAGILRRFYCGSAGLAAISIGALVVQLSIMKSWNRFYRLFAFPAFWLGCIIILCAYAKICLVIYFWGDFRQLRGYELDLPTITAIPVPSGVAEEETDLSVNDHHSPPASTEIYQSQKGTHSFIYPPSTATYSRSVLNKGEEEDVAITHQKHDIEAQNSPFPHIHLQLHPHITPGTTVHRAARKAPSIPLVLPRSPASSLGFDWEAIPIPTKHDLRSRSRQSAVSRTIDQQNAPPHSKKSRRPFLSYLVASPTRKQWDAASKSSADTKASLSDALQEMSEKITPIFAPLTRVVNPLVVRGMAEIVRRSTYWGAFFGLILTAIGFVLPFKGASWSAHW